MPVRSALDHFATGLSLAFIDRLVLNIARKTGQLTLATFERGQAKPKVVKRLWGKTA
jgi:hypothetical protein